MVKRKKPAPSAVIQKRLQRCRQLMKKAKNSACLITNRVDQIYLTGFDGEDGAALITLRDVHLVTDSRFATTFKMKAPWAKLHLRKNGLLSETASLIKSLRLKKVAFQDDLMTVQFHTSLKKACRGIKFEGSQRIVNKLRLIKDRTEINKIRKSIDIAEKAFRAMRRKIKVGMDETEIAALLEYEMRTRGSLKPSFPTIVAEGKNAALPHAEPGKRVIKKGSLLLFDWGATSDYYCSDLTRMLFIGKIPPRFKAVYNIVLEAQQKAIKAVAPGKRMCDIDALARDHITNSGYGEKFGHGLGHGLGLDIHEAPSVRFKVTDKFEPGMVLTIEPGIYLPGSGGVRIEDDVLVTSRGHEVLTTLSRSLASAVI